MTRILHVPANVGNHPFTLSRAERRLGLESDVVDVSANAFGYQADEIRDLSRHSRGRAAAARARVLARALRRYDVVHYNFGEALLPLRLRGRIVTELALAKRLGKTVVVTFQGCDVRPQAACLGCTSAACAADDPWRAPRAAAMARHADRVLYLNPDLAAYLPGARFLPYASVDVAQIEPRPLGEPAELVVAHAPSSPEIKGTAFVVGAVDALRRDGVAVRLDLIQGAGHDEAIERMAAADVVVDQLRIGWYGGVSVEAMALGRPVVCFIDEHANPFGERLPIVRASTATIGAVLGELAADVERRRAAGAAGRAFALAEHDPEQVARRCYEGLFPLPS